MHKTIDDLIEYSYPTSDVIINDKSENNNERKEDKYITDNKKEENSRKENKEPTEIHASANNAKTKIYDDSVTIENKSKITINKDKKKNYFFYKYSKDIPLAEAILIKNHPVFLQIQNGKPILSEIIEIENQTLIPPDKSCYLSKEYVFSSIDEVEQYIKRAQNQNLDSLFQKTKNIWIKYFDIGYETITLCVADTIFTYFQDKLGMTHYLLFVGDNSTGKSNALRVFHNLGYRPLFDVSITTANIYNFLGQFEEGQGIILEDEIDNIDNQEDKMKIYKPGYVSGSQVTRIYDNSNGNNKGKGQQRYNTFCFKAFTSERQPNYKAKGFSERILTVKCSPGNPQYDISEVINDAGDPEHKKLFREIDDLRKLLLVYRIIHYNDQIPDIHLSIKNRDKQLCKPVIRLFNNTKAQKEITNALSKFLTEKRNTKLNSLDFYLFLVISDLVKDENTAISNETLWELVNSLPGNSNPNKPQSFETEDFGTVSKARITKICEDKFGAVRGHDGQKRSLVFSKKMIEKLKVNYSQIQEIKILDNNSLTNTFNTFNTFWNRIEKNRHSKNNLKDNITTRNEEKIDEIAGNSEKNNDINQKSSACFMEDKSAKSDEVLEAEKQTKGANKEQSPDNIKSNSIEGSKDVAISSTLPNYKYTIEDIDNFFASNRGQKEKHVLAESICRPLIGQQNTKPYFYYCKEDPKIENINLKGIEDHIKLKDPQIHKAKLLECLSKKEEDF